MKQLKLFDVPKDSPSRHELLREFCKVHGIETHYCPKQESDEHVAACEDYKGPP